MPIPRRLLAFIVASTCVATACTQAVTGRPTGAPAPSSSSTGASPSTAPASPTPTTPAPTIGPVSLVDCTQILNTLPLSSTLKASVTVGCGRVMAPLDYSNPSGPKVPIVLIKIHSKADTSPTGSLIVNPGGPGGSGIQLAIDLLAEVKPTVLAHFDIVGFDPRGVSLSAPLTCYTDKQFQALLAASPDVRTARGFTEAKAEAKAFADACSSQYGSALPYFNTVITARDLDLVRQAVGDKQMNYLGFSYGTELGSVYAHLFPDKIRVAVLDGAVDPNASGIELAAEQNQGFEDAFDQFATTCLTESPCKDLGNPRKVAIAVQQAALARPLTTDDASRPLTMELATSGIAEALYTKSRWTALGNALLSAQRGNGSGLLALADQYAQRDASGHYSNLLQAFQVISCNDTPAGPSDATIRSTIRSWVQKYPIMGLANAVGLFSCQQWQPARTVPPKPTAATRTKVLVVGNLHDPATPYQGAKDMTADLGNAELLSWNGTGHTSYLSGSTCVDNAVNNYLIARTLPPDRTVCPR